MAFCKEWRANGRIGAYAYRTVYSPNAKAANAKRRATEILKRQHVLDYIAQLEAADAEALRAQATANGGELISAEFVQKEYWRIASASLGDIYEFKPAVKKGGKPRLVVRDPTLLTADHWAAIQSIKVGRDGEIEVKLHDKVRALHDIGLMLRLFPSGRGEEVPLPPPPGVPALPGNDDANDPEAHRRNVLDRLRRQLDDMSKPVIIDNETGKRVG